MWKKTGSNLYELQRGVISIVSGSPSKNNTYIGIFTAHHFAVPPWLHVFFLLESEKLRAGETERGAHE